MTTCLSKMLLVPFEASECFDNRGHGMRCCCRNPRLMQSRWRGQCKLPVVVVVVVVVAVVVVVVVTA